MTAKQPFFLYLEDDSASREIMGVLLKDVMGFTNLTIFEDSNNFVERVAKLPNAPDIILLDIHLKPHDGHEIFQMIRQTEKLARTIPVAVTASVMSNEVERLREAGFRHLIGKPINPLTFPDKLTEILSGKEVWDVSWD
jgi:two-component system chemotaxis response regulator CheY